ncbi:MAG: bifunctional riboflavin kinase/FAD synthetase [Tissierellia bacterium]|nr:bifunctional riboflavin kinase/FAD synthetase [Tissierellia bacterium]
MKIIDAMNSSEKKYVTAVALGNFDGIHIGHQYLLKSNIEKAKEENLKPSVLIFKNHTKTILKKDENFKIDILTSFEEKIQLLKELGIEIVYVMDFNEQIMKLSPELFVKNILLERLNAKLVTVGFDYRFGYKAQGDSNYLKELGKANGFVVNVIDPVYVEGEIVSSTIIRNLIINGYIEKANKLLGRNYCLIGTVIKGRSRGRKLGFPTANIRLNDRYVIPKTGVYKTFTYVDNSKFLSLTNIGYNPTFNEKNLKIETYILDFDEDIYDSIIKIEFMEFIRDDIKFNSVEELKNQMHKDVLYIKNN